MVEAKSKSKPAGPTKADKLRTELADEMAGIIADLEANPLVSLTPEEQQTLIHLWLVYS